MRPQKSKRFRDVNTTRIQDRWSGYFMEDINCLHCVHWRGKRKGCPFKACAFEAEKLDAIKHGRIKPPPKPTPKPPPPLEGIALWESILHKTDTAEIYNLMQQHGGYQHFVDLMTESRSAHETIDNAIKANEQRISAWGYIRKDIADLNRTRKVYNEYKALQKSTKFFAKRTAEKFHEKHEDEIYTHERALRDLQGCKRPLPTIKEIDEEIAKGKNVNEQNAKHYRAAKAEHTRFTTVHRKLYAVNNEHKPKAPQRQKQQSRGIEI